MTCCHATAIELGSDGRAICAITTGGEPQDLEHAIVDGLLPGETAQVRLGRRRKGIREGKLEGPIQGSQRLPAACPHSRVCGGCRTQELSYATELLWKQQSLEKLFPGVSIEQIQPSPQRFAYRNKMEWTFSQDRAGRRFLGLYGRGMRGVVDIQQCALVRPWMSQSLTAMREWWALTGISAYSPPRNEGVLRTLTLREGFRTGDRLACLLVHDDEKHKIFPHLETLRKILKPLCHNIVLRFQISRVGSPTRFEQLVLEGHDYLEDVLLVGQQALHMRVSPTAFSQPNPYLAELLYAATLEEVNPSEALIDLFAGTGTLGLLAAQRGCKVVSVELSEDACKDALRNRARNQLDERHAVYCGDAGAWLLAQTSPISQLIVDPPRSGLGPVVCQWLIDHQPQRILYISCNPKTQKTDCEALQAAGYAIQRARPFDQFPNTPHMEQLVVLERRRASTHDYM